MRIPITILLVLFGWFSSIAQPGPYTVIRAGSNVTVTTNTMGRDYTIASSGGGGSQTPWTSDINGNGKSLTNVLNLSVTGTENVNALNPTNIVGPYDATVGAFVGTNGSGASGFSRNGNVLTNIAGTNIQLSAGTAITLTTNSDGSVTVASTATGGAPDISTFVQTVAIFEDFVGKYQAGSAYPAGPLELVGFGTTGFSTAVNGISNAPGIYELSPGNSAGNFFLLNSEGNAGLHPFNMRGVWTNEYRFRLQNTNNPGIGSGSTGSNHMYFLGFGNLFNSSLPTDGVYLQYDTNNTQFAYVSSVGSTRVTNLSGVTPTAGQFYKFRVVFTALTASTTTNAVCTIDGANSQTFTSTQVPASKSLSINAMTLNPGGDQVGGNLDLDYIYLGYKLEVTR